MKLTKSVPSLPWTAKIIAPIPRDASVCPLNFTTANESKGDPRKWEENRMGAYKVSADKEAFFT